MIKSIVCVDLGGVICTEDTHELIPGALEFLKTLRTKYYVIIWSTRNNPLYHKGQASDVLTMKLEKWMRDNHLPFDEVWDAADGKPKAKWYIDNKAISCTPETDNYAFKGVLSDLGM